MTMACAQPGCSGAIEDGYCNLCGLAPAPGMSWSPASTRSSAALRTAGSAGSI